MKWEVHQRTLANNLREASSDTVKLGILVQKLPKQAHDFVLRTFAKELNSVERVRTLVANIVAMTAGSGHAQMDMGECHGERGGVDERSVSWVSGLGARASRLPHGCRKPEGLERQGQGNCEERRKVQEGRGQGA